MKERIYGDIGKKSLSFHIVVSSITKQEDISAPKEVPSNSIIKCLKDNWGYGLVYKDNCHQGCHMVEEDN